MSKLVGKWYIAEFTGQGVPIVGEIEELMGDDTYLCRNSAGELSCGMPVKVGEMAGWRFFNNQKEIQVFLRAAETMRQNQLKKQESMEKEAKANSRKRARADKKAKNTAELGAKKPTVRRKAPTSKNGNPLG